MKIAVIAEKKAIRFQCLYTNLVQSNLSKWPLGSNEIGQYREVGVYYDTCSFLGGEGTAYLCLKIAYCGIEIHNQIYQ